MDRLTIALSDTQEEVTSKMNAIKQERLETQNIIMVRCWQIREVDMLKEEAQREEAADKQAQIEQSNQNLLTNGNPQPTIEPPQEQESSIIKLPEQSLGEHDKVLHRICQSPQEMMQASNEAIDPLLERWTNWHEVRERRHARNSGGATRFMPMNEDEERSMFRDREESPRGLYLEGNTTDWRKPQSAAARSEAAKLRKRYSGYQATVSADSSEVDLSPGSKGSKKTARSHVISDSSDSSDDERREAVTKNRRKSSGSPTTQRRPHLDGPPLASSYSSGQSMANRRLSGTTTYTTLRSSVSQPHPSTVHRPGPTPNQNPSQHSNSAPVPPINTSNAPNLYVPGGTYSPNQQMPPYGNFGVQTHPRYMPPSGRIQIPPRPGSQDGKSRSPSRLPQQGSHSGRSHAKTEERKISRAQAQKNIREGAKKGILGAGALAGFLEVLEGL